MLKVNGQVIESAEIDAEIERLKPQYDEHVRTSNPDGGDEQLREWSTENVIERVLLGQEAATRDMDLPEDEVEQLVQALGERFPKRDASSLKAQAEAELKAQRLMTELGESASVATEAEAKRYYGEHREEFNVPERVQVSHIVKHIDGGQDKTQAYVAILNALEEVKESDSFEAVVAEHSDCPEQGGSLGWFGRGQMVPEFEDVVFAMKPGDISDAFLTQFGYHIAKLQDRREAGPAPFEEVRDFITQEICEQKQMEVVERFVDELRDRAVIEGKGSCL